MNVCEYSKYVNHKDRGIKYPEYREDVPSRISIPSKKVLQRRSFKEGGGKPCGDIPIQPTTRICSSGWGCLVVLQAISNTGRTAQLKRGVSVRQRLRRRYACKYVRGTGMCVVCCSASGWGCLVVLQAISNTGRTAQLKRGVSVRQRLRRLYACKYVHGTGMCVVCCSENGTWVWSVFTVSQ